MILCCCIVRFPWNSAAATNILYIEPHPPGLKNIFGIRPHKNNYFFSVHARPAKCRQPVIFVIFYFQIKVQYLWYVSVN
jgi:hypothetical protein